MNFLKKKKKPASPPSANDKLRAQAHEKLDDAHERLDRVLVKLRHVKDVMTAQKLATK